MGQLCVSHIGICVSDWRRSLAFYRDCLGFEHEHELEISGEAASTLLRLDDVEFRAIYLTRDGVRIELLHFEEPGHRAGDVPRPLNQLGLTHLSLRVDDLDAFLSELAAADVAIVDATRVESPDSGTRAIFITDPDGTLIELVQQHGG